MANPFAAAVALQKRASFAGANTGRLYADWVASIASPDVEVQYNLRLLRARSRELVRNNSYAAGFVEELANHVIGADGVALQARVTDPAGEIRREVNWEIERAWREWGAPETASVDGQDGWIDLQRLVIKTLATDGEVFLRHRRGYPNAFGYAVQMLDADLLDETYDVPPNDRGVEVRMGVERDADGRPLGYWFWTAHPYDRFARTRERVRIPAEEIVHLFIRYRPGQTRGVPWFAPVMADLRMLGGLTEAELVAARVSASKMGFITNKTEDAIAAYAAKLARGEVQRRAFDVAPGVIDELDPGQEFQSFDPTHPSAAFEAFSKLILRGIARGLGVSYLTFTGDVSAANYSSMRAGLLPERDRYRVLQVWTATHMHRPVYRAWLPMAMLAGAVRLPTPRAADYHAVEWKGRGWKWVDPLKDLAAAELGIHLGIESRTRLVAEQGRDFEDVVDDLAEEQRYAEEAGVWIGGAGGVERTQTESEQKTEDEGEDDAPARNGNGKGKAARIERLLSAWNGNGAHR